MVDTILCMYFEFMLGLHFYFVYDFTCIFRFTMYILISFLPRFICYSLIVNDYIVSSSTALCNIT